MCFHPQWYRDKYTTTREFQLIFPYKQIKCDSVPDIPGTNRLLVKNSNYFSSNYLIAFAFKKNLKF